MESIDEVGYKEVPPDPSIADAVGRHHSLATAVADLVDNSIDAEAARVHIRFMSENGFVRGLRVIDDGRGMSSADMDRAMTFGGRRAYAPGDLGNFGLGLKAASLSQADQLDVYTRALGSSVFAGRRILAGRATRVVELGAAGLTGLFGATAAQIPGGPVAHGTIVEWRDVRTFLSSPSEEERRAWLEDTVESLRAHLGLVLHRILSRGDVTITIDEFDSTCEMAGPARRVDPIDPFRAPGGIWLHSSELRGSLPEGDFVLSAAIWPASGRSSPEFRLFGLPGSRSQGFFIYRHDRLLQAGGWNGVVHGGREMEFARVVVEIDAALASHTTINPEKSGVEFDSDLRAAIDAAVSEGGTTFRDYLAEAEQASAASRRRTRRPIMLSEVRRGLSPELRDTLADSVVFSEHGPIEIRWKLMRGGTFVEVDLEHRTLWLNTQHRRALGALAGEADDLPLFKMLLLLLYSRFFEGAMLGAREKNELQVWQELIDAALDEELERRSYGEEPSSGR
ncbi:ATPase [Leucobacter sp. Psy1]|uniref:ATP-binding protein n=1 Tax=Leucobacter sp. Psy1 TaxID=2875729 RepID=UPI001CD6A47F|nr:ATP-binding protein [Leucobacter sp. Psy1]UBH05866.1 ATPase [Leucobacter sp. Psy1]